MTLGLKVDIKAGGTISFGKVRMKAVFRKAGREVADAARKLIRSKAAPGRSRSTPGGPPTSLTGALARSLKVTPFRNGEGVSVRDTQFYALFLEAGAAGGVSGGHGKKGSRNPRQHGKKLSSVGRRVLLPRPFLSTALDAKRPSIEARLRAAINDDIKWQKQK